MRVEAYGTIDELVSWIGLLRDHKENSKRKNMLIYIQDQLLKYAVVLGSKAGRITDKELLPDPDSVQKLENEIDKMQKKLVPLTKCIVPGGKVLISYCHIARCVCRRAERSVLKLNQTEKIPETIIKFLNRLSDYLFVLSRKISLELDIEEIKWPI